MTLFSEPETCQHGREVGQCPFCLSRSSDPVTSYAAARSLDHTLKDQHRMVLEWLADNGPATDDETAAAMVAAGVTARTETARRWVRTLREAHGAIVAAYDNDGTQLQRVNPSGRHALAWVVDDDWEWSASCGCGWRCAAADSATAARMLARHECETP